MLLVGASCTEQLVLHELMIDNKKWKSSCTVGQPEPAEFVSVRIITFGVSGCYHCGRVCMGLYAIDVCMFTEYGEYYRYRLGTRSRPENLGHAP